MKNLRSNGHVLTLTAPSGGVTAGVGYVIGNTFVVALQTAAVGEQFAGTVVGEFNLPKSTSDALVEGAAVYWDNTTKLVRAASATGRYLIGTATQVQLAADAYGYVRLNGVHVTAVP